MTELYIEMCRAATELQEAWKINYGDTIYSESIKIERGIYCVCSWFYKDKYILIVYDKTGNYNKHIAIDEPITWLPTIEQLVELIIKLDGLADRVDFGYNNEYDILFNHLFKWAAWINKSDWQTNLLAYLMEQCFNKTWNCMQKCWEAI